ncbi:DUF92 domain-containing protein [soil metagenome]
MTNSLANHMQSTEPHWWIAFVAALLVALAAYRLRALTMDGMVAATLVGGSIVTAAGWWPGVVLVSYVITASALSLFRSQASASVPQVRGKQRDAVQVLANGGIPAALAVVSAFTDSPGPWLVALTASIAGAASDTWGTELGRFSGSRPRLVTSWKPAAAGTSGAISPIGTASSLASAIAIGLVAGIGYAFGWDVPGFTAGALIAIIALAGFCGSLFDSLLGATVQAGFRCPACDVLTEHRVHACGTPTVRVKGWTWLNNDAVNMLAIAGSATIGLVAATI